MRRAVAVLLFAWFASPAGAQSPRVEGLLKRLSLEEKLALLHGDRDPQDLGQAGYWPGLPRLGIPPMRLADGPAGVNVTRDATGVPAPVGLAATFSVEAARLYGVVMGRDARALGQDVLLAPQVDIVRDPLFRRNHTTLGEDPVLNAQLATAEVLGIQSQGEMAQVKHLAGYNGSDNVVIDEHTLHEIYLPAFEGPVRAGASSLMCSYNLINGYRACENDALQNGIVRGLWEFAGFITSDWGAIHGPAALSRGADMEMPGRAMSFNGGPYFNMALAEAVKQGAIPVAEIDRAVGRILFQMERFGLLDGKAAPRPTAIDIEADAKIARQIAAQGAVLLKNQGEALPLQAADLASLAVIGPTAGQVAAGFLGERARGFGARLITPVTALRQLAPGAHIVYSIGNDLTGVPLPVAGQSEVSLEPGKDYSWSGAVTAAREGEYAFMVQSGGPQGAEASGSIAVDGAQLVRSGTFGSGGVIAKRWSSLLPTTDGRDNARATLHLTAGPHQVRLTASSTGGAAAQIRFAWMTPGLRETHLAAAVAAAKAAHTAIVFAWQETGSGLALPEDQDDLISRVAAANPRTIVVLNTGSPVAMPWKDQASAILEMWYPGQEGGWATADLLLGRANPAGKLPVTFPARLEDTPARAAGHPERLAKPAAPGAAARAEGLAVTFTEGIAVGYRWYDQQNLEPLFPFGYGLSYTRFEYTDIGVRRAGEGLDVSFTLRNSGRRRGAEAPQVYVGAAPAAPVAMAPKSLAAFASVELDAGQSRRLTLHIDARALSYWSAETHAWVLPAGNRMVYVGSSSRDIRLRAQSQ
jgi:beta-glucosidase